MAIVVKRGPGGAAAGAAATGEAAGGLSGPRAW